MRSLRSILECSYQIAKIDDWAEVVSAHLASPASILSRMRGLEDSGICTGPLLAAFFNLAQTLKVCKATKTKGQIISECPYEIIVWTKIPTKNFPRFLH